MHTLIREHWCPLAFGFSLSKDESERVLIAIYFYLFVLGFFFAVAWTFFFLLKPYAHNLPVSGLKHMERQRRINYIVRSKTHFCLK